MSALLLLLFFSILLLVGFGLNAWSLSALIILMASGLAFFMSLLDIEEVKRNWSTRRCDLDILLTSFLYKPSDDPRSVNEFTTENFSFCTRAAFRDILGRILTPVLVVLGQSMDSAKVLDEAFNKFRELKASGMQSFDSFMKPFWQKFRQLGISFSHVFSRLYSAFRRAAAMAMASLYSALSAVTAVMNFTNFMIFIVRIILGILCALMIILFLVLAPFIGIIILPVIWSMQDNGLASVVGPVANCFCFSPRTWIQKQDGTSCTIDQCRPGDILRDGGTIEGVLRVEKGRGDMYSLDGIVVSGSHLIWSPDEQGWIPIAKYTGAKRIYVLSDKDAVYCLRTSTRNIEIQGLQGQWFRFRDWEELPLDLPEADAIWDEFVSQILQDLPSSGTIPQDDPMLGPCCEVLYSTGEKRRISEVRMGDILYSKDGFTRVTGVYEGRTDSLDSKTMTDGIWFFDSDQHKWTHPAISTLPSTEANTTGWHLTTESGTFWVETKQFSGFVRDFTEVGAARIHLTYPLTAALLKKSKLQGESCNWDSLSQAS